MVIRYGSISVGTISVVIDNHPAHKVNVHSSGALANRMLNAIIDGALIGARAVTK